MAAGLGFKTFTTGEVLTAADVNGYLMQGVLVFADAAARTSAITSPQEGQYSFLKDTNALEYYDGASWVGAPVGDITAVNAGTGISGGGSSGSVTITNSMATEITAKGDLIVGTGNATFDNLPVGTNGYTLVADSVEATGLKWVAPATSGTFAAWTPTWTNVTVGNGTVTAQYAEVGSLVFGYIKLEWGSTTSQSGDAIFSLPVNCTNVSGIRWGIGSVVKSGEAPVVVLFQLNSTSTGSIRYLLQATSPDRIRDNDIGGTSPYTFTTNSTFGLTFWYRKA